MCQCITLVKNAGEHPPSKASARESALRAVCFTRASRRWPPKRSRPSDLRGRSAPSRFSSGGLDTCALLSAGRCVVPACAASHATGEAGSPCQRPLAPIGPLRSREPSTLVGPVRLCVRLSDGSRHWPRTARAASFVREAFARALYPLGGLVLLSGCTCVCRTARGVGLTPRVLPRALRVLLVDGWLCPSLSRVGCMCDHPVPVGAPNLCAFCASPRINCWHAQFMMKYQKISHVMVLNRRSSLKLHTY